MSEKKKTVTYEELSLRLGALVLTAGSLQQHIKKIEKMLLEVEASARGIQLVFEQIQKDWAPLDRQGHYENIKIHNKKDVISENKD